MSVLTELHNHYFCCVAVYHTYTGHQSMTEPIASRWSPLVNNRSAHAPSRQHHFVRMIILLKQYRVRCSIVTQYLTNDPRSLALSKDLQSVKER